jgi:pyrroline-5-carboxylate reductase
MTAIALGIGAVEGDEALARQIFDALGKTVVLDESLLQTITGAAGMLEERGSDAARLRLAVTSPGGTTAAALGVFQAGGFESIVVEGIRAARDRGVELNR